MAAPQTHANKDPSSTSLHHAPTAWPFIGLVIMYTSLIIFFWLLRTTEWLRTRFFRLVDAPDDVRPLLYVTAACGLLGVAYDFWRRFRTPILATHVRVNRALLYAFLFTIAWNCWRITKSLAHMQALAYDERLQITNLVLILVVGLLFLAIVFHPLVKEAVGAFPSYQEAVASLDESYDFIVGVEYPDDWKQAKKGPKRWLILPEKGIWQNLFALGSIGKGKTQALLYPLLIQALRKFRNNDELRPSAVVFDLKGDVAETMWRYCKRLGRTEDFWVIRPGNKLQDDKGKDLIPADRFLTYAPLGGSTESADVRAELFSSGLQATDTGESHQFWRDTQVQFLTATLQIYEAVRPGNYTLKDIYLFSIDPSLRDKLIKSDQGAGSPAQTYFSKYFNAFSKEDQMKLLAGIAAKLSRITGDAVSATFAADPDSHTRAFTTFEDMLLTKSGVIVFSVPEATYSTDLARILGVMFMRSFHNAMLRRSDTVFKARGGNGKRLVMLCVDECWAFMNPGVASFCNVSRQARVFSLFLTQSLKAMGDNYREAVMSGFLSKVCFSINDDLSLTTMAKSFGQYEETTTNISTSESLGEARNKVYSEGKTGKNQSMSRSTSTQTRMVDRFTPTDLKYHEDQSRAVCQLSDGNIDRLPVMMETPVAYRLTYWLFHPLDHDDVGCPSTRRKEPHRYVKKGDAEVCENCGHTITSEQRADINSYRAAHPNLLPAC